MGCDIHLVLEQRRGDRWIMAPGQPYNDTLFIWRNYGVFNTLVGSVRPSEMYIGRPTICDTPRGLPEDAFPQTLELLSSSDYHSHSWITAIEFVHFFPWRPRLEEMTQFTALVWALMHPRSYVHYADYRLVFAFDN